MGCHVLFSSGVDGHLVSYISFVFVQFATNLKEVLDNWNIGTILWLRRYVEPVSVQAAQPCVTRNPSVYP